MYLLIKTFTQGKYYCYYYYHYYYYYHCYNSLEIRKQKLSSLPKVRQLRFKPTQHKYPTAILEKERPANKNGQCGFYLKHCKMMVWTQCYLVLCGWGAQRQYQGNHGGDGFDSFGSIRRQPLWQAW